MRFHSLAIGLAVAALVLTLATAGSAAVVLRMDVEERGTPDLLAGFESITLDDGGFPNATKTFAGGITVDIDAVGYSFGDHDRHRSVPSDAWSQGALYRDFIFAPNDSTGLDTTITGLTPNQNYRVSIWSWDDGSVGSRVSDWSVVDARGTVSVRENYTFDGSVDPRSDAANQFSFEAIADGSGQIVVQGRGDPATTGTAPSVFLNALELEEIEGPPPTSLSIDVNDRGAAGPGSTQPGFVEFTLHGSEPDGVRSSTLEYGSVRVSIGGAAGNINDRRRSEPTNSGAFDQQELLRDFVFGDVRVAGEEVDIVVDGLAPDTNYLATIWAFDDLSGTPRSSEWYSAGMRVVDFYQFDGDDVPPAPADNQTYAFGFVTTSDASGRVTITGTNTAGNLPGVFIDALRLEETTLQPPPPPPPPPPFAPPILAVDFNDRGATGPGNTQDGFSEFLLTGSGSTTQTIGAFDVTVAGVNASLDDRRRGEPTNEGSFTQQELLRDFIFANNGSIDNEEVNLVVAGLTPGQRYLATVWSFDDGSAPVRTSDWFANGQQVVDDYQFNGGDVPPAPPGNQTYAFAFYTEADGAGELTINGVAQPGTQPALFLDALTLDVVDPPKLLQIDFNARSSTGPFSTQPGFYEFLLSGSGTTDSTTQTFGSTRVTVTASGAGTTLDDRRRGAPVNSGDFDQQEALRDFIFANNTGIEDEGMDILIEGLEPDVEYGVTIWSFDDLSSPTRTSDWYVNGQLVLDDYAFNGDDVPPSPSDNGVYSFTFYSVADSNGELLISAVAEPGTQPAIFLNALAIRAAVPEPATIVLMVLGVLIVVPAAAHRRGRTL